MEPTAGSTGAGGRGGGGGEVERGSRAPRGRG